MHVRYRCVHARACQRAAFRARPSTPTVAKSGRSKHCSSKIAQAFDELLLLKEGGRQTYWGPTGVDSEALIAYLQVMDALARLIVCLRK